MIVKNVLSRITIFVHVLLLTGNLVSAQNFCIQLFQNETPRLHSKDDRSSLTSELSETVRSHVLDGEYLSDGKLDGGMHTVDGFFRLFELNKILRVEIQGTDWNEIQDLLSLAEKMYPRQAQSGFGYAVLRMLSNGVVLVEVPDAVMSKKARNASLAAGLRLPGGANLKSLFPIGWSKDFITSTIKYIAAQATYEERYVMRATRKNIRGVNVVVRFDEKGRIATAFPALDQPNFAPEIKVFSAHQQVVIDAFFTEPLAEKIHNQQGFAIQEGIDQGNTLHENRNWFDLIPVEKQRKILENFKRLWMIDDAEAVREGLSEGFNNSLLIKANIEKNLGAITFKQRLELERPKTPANQTKQKARQLLIHFGVTGPTMADIENVSQILLNRTDLFTPDLQRRLNLVARKSIVLYSRPVQGANKLDDSFEYDAEYNWLSIFFTDLKSL